MGGKQKYGSTFLASCRAGGQKQPGKRQETRPQTTVPGMPPPNSEYVQVGEQEGNGKEYGLSGKGYKEKKSAARVENNGG